MLIDVIKGSLILVFDAREAMRLPRSVPARQSLLTSPKLKPFMNSAPVFWHFSV